MSALLKHALERIRGLDAEGDYEQRNVLILEALFFAAVHDMPVGFRIDPAEPEWPVAYIKLPTGQVSWHLPQFPEPWDGHTTAEKYERISAYTESVERAL